MRWMARNIAIVLTTMATAALVWQMRGVVILFVVSVAIAAALRPVVEELIEHRWPRSIALGVTYFTGLVVLAWLVYLAAGPLVDEVREATDDAAAWYAQLAANWPQGNGVEKVLAANLPTSDALHKALSGERGLAAAQMVLGVTWNVLENVVRLVLILALSIYWNLDRVRFERLWLSLLPPDERVEMREVWHATESGLGAYLRSEVVQGTLAGLLLALGYHLLGLQWPTLWSVWGAVAWLFPWVGLPLAILPAVVVAAHGGVLLAVAAGIYALGVFLLLKFLIEPRLFDRRRFNSLLVVLAALALANYFGLMGLLLGPPLAVALQICFDHSLRRPLAGAELEVSITTLEERLVQAREIVAGREPPPELANLLARLTALVENSRHVLDNNMRAGVA
jgi:putative permease